jgi:polyphosphate glucokinase
MAIHGHKASRILVIDIGGSHVKLLVTGRRVPIKIDSGPKMTPSVMVAAVREATAGWKYDVISVGFPGPIERGRPAQEPWNLGAGWVGFDFRRAFGCPVRVVNDAAMQALGSYAGRRMLFLGLGTGLGSALISYGTMIPLELAHLPYKHGLSYEEYLGEAGLLRLRKKSWRRQVVAVVALFKAAFQVDYVVLGGGNAKLLDVLPPFTRRGSNANAFRGGFRLWEDAYPPSATASNAATARSAATARGRSARRTRG